MSVSSWSTVHRVLGQLARRVGPLLELLDDPRQLPGGRVVQAVRQGLRPGGLDHRVAGAVLVLVLAEPGEFGLGQPLELGRVAGREPERRR